MRSKIAAALAALPFAATANAANVYSACFYGGYSKNLPVTQLFLLEGDALRDYYGEWTYEKNLVWEEKFATEPGRVRPISGYMTGKFVSQFVEHAEASGHRGECWVTTSRQQAREWFNQRSRDGGVNVTELRDWRPTKTGVVGVQDWTGRAVAGGEVESEAQADDHPSRTEEKTVAAPTPPSRPKMTNAEADAKYEADMAEYKRKPAQQQKEIDDFKRAQDEVARKREELRLAAERAAADHQRQLAVHAEAVRNQQVEYQKEVAKPAGVANAVYRGFWGPDCATARLSATKGAGTSSTTRFKEVTTESPAGGCIVQGWWWNVAGGGTATRQ